MEALIIIDVQNGIISKDLFKKEEFIENINKVIIKNRKINNVIIFIQHNSKTLVKGSYDWEIYPEVLKHNDDIIFQKRHGDAFNNTNLKQYLEENKIENVSICGLVSHGCIFHTCKSGLENGFNVKIIKNGHTNWLRDADRKINEINKELEKMGIKII